MCKTLIKYLPALVVVIGLTFSAATADAKYVFRFLGSVDHGDGTWTNFYEEKDTKTGESNIWWEVYDEDYNILAEGSTNPDPEAGGSGGSEDPKEAVKQLLLKGGGGAFRAEVDFWETPFGKQLVEGGNTGSIVPVHNPADITPGDGGGQGGGTGGFDPNGGSIVEQLKKGQKKQGDDDKSSGDAGSDDHDPGEFALIMDLVNPVPIDLPQTLSAKKFPTTFATLRR